MTRDLTDFEKNHIGQIPQMSREHLENFAEYVIMQRITPANSAPGYIFLEDEERAAWVRGCDDFARKLLLVLFNPFELARRLPDRPSMEGTGEES